MNIFTSCMSKKVVKKVVEPTPVPKKPKICKNMFCKKNVVLEKQIIDEEPTETTDMCMFCRYK